MPQQYRNPDEISAHRFVSPIVSVTFELATRLERARETIYRSAFFPLFLTDFDKREIKFIGNSRGKISNRPRIRNINNFSPVSILIILYLLTSLFD